MKILFSDDLKFIVFLNKLYLKDASLDKRDKLEQYFKKLFLKFQQFYDIKINGYYNIEVYLDQNYGAVMELEKEELDMDYFDSQVDMRIVIHQTNFLYLLDNYQSFDSEKYDIIYYHKKWYVRPKSEIDSIEMGSLLEHTEICYKEKNELILEKGTKVI